MKESRALFLLQYLVKSGSFAFSNVLRHCLDTAPKNALTELNLDDITDLQIVSRFDDSGIDHYVAFAASVVCHGTALNDTGYL